LIVDKQGGRNTYTELLKNQLPMVDIRVIEEGARVSTYEVEAAHKQMKVSFVEKGEDMCMSVALASMFSKYIRELFMRLENQYWLQLLPGLKPTAGYYSDAQRFLAQIAHMKQKESIQDDILIRIK
jgi:ribonuclease HII